MDLRKDSPVETSILHADSSILEAVDNSKDNPLRVSHCESRVSMSRELEMEEKELVEMNVDVRSNGVGPIYTCSEWRLRQIFSLSFSRSYVIYPVETSAVRARG